MKSRRTRTLELVIGATMLTHSSAFAGLAYRRALTVTSSHLKRKFVDRSIVSRQQSAVSNDNENQSEALVGKSEFSSPSRQAVETLLGAAIGRAVRTLSTNTQNGEISSTSLNVRDGATVVGLLESTVQRASSTLDGSSASSPPTDEAYLKNPSITSTALAHELWSHVVRPNNDIVIDATCGNGRDSVAIAKLLFDSNTKRDDAAKLICIDIQQKACDSTRQALSQALDSDVLEDKVQVLETSHASLIPLVEEGSTVGLVCYNLGYLPSADKDVLTLTESTIASIADAALLLRVGGMISVTTYPRTNPNENHAVRALMEGLALLSSRDTTWQDSVQKLGPNPDKSLESETCYSARDAVVQAMNRIQQEGDQQQTWRVMQHKKIGQLMAPILLTATLIK